MRISKKYIILFLAVLLVVSNVCWLKIYHKEQEKLKSALIPPLSEDYFTTQKIITDYLVQKENNQVNIFNPLLEIDLGRPFPYNFYFRTVQEYQNYRKENANIKDVPLVLQNPKYPNGCESASAVMLLNYVGISITLDDFIENYLEKDTVYEKDGVRYGPDPSKVYAGDPSSETRGWGTFEPVIAESVNKILDNYHKKNEIFLKISASNKMPLYFLAAYEYPVVIWVTMDYQESDSVYNWFSADYKFTYTYPKNSHTVVLTGMDEDFYYINDPLKEEKNIPIPKEQLESSFNSMGRQFISFEK